MASARPAPMGRPASRLKGIQRMYEEVSEPLNGRDRIASKAPDSIAFDPLRPGT